MIAEYQSHSGEVNINSAPKSKYAYTEMLGGANHSRLTSMTYPDGFVVNYNFSSGLNDAISRLSSLSDTSGTLESYSYLGLGTVVIRSHSQPGVDLTYMKQSGESNGDAGDQYTGLDRFGRVVDQRWRATGLVPVDLDRFQYGYERDGNRLCRDNLANSAFGELYSYDNLNQITSFDRSALNRTKTGLTSSASRSQDWDFDALGIFDSVTTDSSTQTRSHNEITSISGSTTPTYHANGNMTGDETGRKFVYDAFMRLAIFLFTAAMPVQAQPDQPKLYSTIKTEFPVGLALFSPDGKTLAILTGGGKLLLWDVATQKVRDRFENPVKHPVALVYAIDGKSLFAADLGTVVQVNLANGKVKQLYKEDTTVNRLIISPDGKTLASCGMFNSFTVWDIQGDKPVAVFRSDDYISDMAFLPNGKSLIAASGGGAQSVPGQSLRVWDDVTGKVKWRFLRNSPDAEYCLALSPDGKSLAAPIPEHFVGVWDVKTGELRAKWKDESNWIGSLCYSRDGRVIIIVGGVKGLLGPIGRIFMLDAVTGKELTRFNPIGGEIRRISLSPDGKLLAATQIGPSKKEVKVWDISSIAPHSKGSGNSKK